MLMNSFLDLARILHYSYTLQYHSCLGQSPGLNVLEQFSFTTTVSLALYCFASFPKVWAQSQTVILQCVMLSVLTDN